MTQRNPLNSRYQSDEKLGKTRKSAAAAKPSTKAAATVCAAPPKTKKEKRAEEAARARKIRARQLPQQLDAQFNVPTPEYKRVRRLWWIVLITAIVLVTVSFLLTKVPGVPVELSTVILVIAYAFIIYAIYLDVGKTRKLRRAYQAAVLNNKSKAIRAEQKRLHAQNLEAARKRAEQPEEAPTPRKGVFARLFGKKK